MHKVVYATVLLALTGCAHQTPPQYLADSKGTAASVLLPDGHSTESWLVGGTCADPNCVSQQSMVEGVYTTYDVNGRLKSVPHDLRTDVAPSLGMAAASITVPYIIGSAGAIGAGIELGNHIRPNMLSITTTGSTANAVGGVSNSVSSALGGSASATGGNASAISNSSAVSNAAATAQATQSQMQSVQAINPGVVR